MKCESKTIEFIRQKIIDAEKALNARMEMQKIWLKGNDAAWNAAADLHPSTFGRRIYKADRIKESALQGRIIAKCRHELHMFKNVLTELLTTKEPRN